MIQQINIFFPAAWSLNYLFPFFFGNYFNYILKVIIYFNTWQLQIILFYHHFALNYLFQKSPPPSPEIKWWPPNYATTAAPGI